LEVITIATRILSIRQWLPGQWAFGMVPWRLPSRDHAGHDWWTEHTRDGGELQVLLIYINVCI